MGGSILWARSHTWRICPSLQAIRPLEGSLCHCLEPQMGHLRRPGVIFSPMKWNIYGGTKKKNTRITPPYMDAY